MYVRNACSYKNNTASHPRRRIPHSHRHENLQSYEVSTL
jgi:hypothetical protein